MCRALLLIVIWCLSGCSSSQPKDYLTLKKELPGELKEISGINAVTSGLWAITDKPHAKVYQLNAVGDILRKVKVSNAEASDVEAVTSDDENLYIGDLGDNTGDRVERKIIKVAFTGIRKGSDAEVKGEEIEFVFPGGGETTTKKKNNFDCESLLSYKDSLYVFTKDREDNETRLYSLPKTPGKYIARFINTFNAKGLVTDAAINAAGDEVALVGYHKGHTFPFIILFHNFRGNDFFSGDHEQINLADKKWDWQIEGITYGADNTVYFSCEATDEVPATLYGIQRENLQKLNREAGKETSLRGEKRNKGKPGTTAKNG